MIDADGAILAGNATVDAAAEAGITRVQAVDADGQFTLGVMYQTERGVPQDYVEAHKWRNLAAAHASADNQKAWADTRDALEKVMTPQQLAEAQKRASAWQAAFEQRTK